MDHKEEIVKIMEIIEDATDGFLLGSTCNAMINMVCWKTIRAKIDKKDFIEKISIAWDHHKRIFE